MQAELDKISVTLAGILAFLGGTGPLVGPAGGQTPYAKAATAFEKIKGKD